MATTISPATASEDTGHGREGGRRAARDDRSRPQCRPGPTATTTSPSRRTTRRPRRDRRTPQRGTDHESRREPRGDDHERHTHKESDAEHEGIHLNAEVGLGPPRETEREERRCKRHAPTTATSRANDGDGHEPRARVQAPVRPVTRRGRAARRSRVGPAVDEAADHDRDTTNPRTRPRRRTRPSRRNDVDRLAYRHPRSRTSAAPGTRPSAPAIAVSARGDPYEVACRVTRPTCGREHLSPAKLPISSAYFS